MRMPFRRPCSQQLRSAVLALPPPAPVIVPSTEPSIKESFRGAFLKTLCEALVHQQGRAQSRRSFRFKPKPTRSPARNRLEPKPTWYPAPPGETSQCGKGMSPRPNRSSAQEPNLGGEGNWALFGVGWRPGRWHCFTRRWHCLRRWHAPRPNGLGAPPGTDSNPNPLGAQPLPGRPGPEGAHHLVLDQQMLFWATCSVGQDIDEAWWPAATVFTTSS
jgi:hypothetical protein